MLNSSFCREQRQKEQHRSQKVLALALVSSGVFHAILASAINGVYNQPNAANEPIELIIIEQPKTDSFKNSPNPKSELVPKTTPKQKFLQEITQPSELQKTTQIKSTNQAKTSSSATQSVPQTGVTSPSHLTALNKLPASPQSSPITTSYPSSLSTAGQRQPVFTSSHQATLSIATPDINLSNPVTPVSSIDSIPPKPNKISQPSSGNSQGIEPLKAGLTNTSSAPLAVTNESEKITHPTSLSTQSNPPALLTSSPVPVATTGQYQPILTSSNHTPSISATNINLSNPVTPISANSSAPPKPNGISQPSSGNPQKTEQLKVGLTRTSSAPSASFNTGGQITSTSTPITTSTPQLSKPPKKKKCVVLEVVSHRILLFLRVLKAVLWYKF